MCGIFGVLKKQTDFSEAELQRYTRHIEKRGPDGFGKYLEPGVGLAMRRLSIIDLEGGWQPFLSNNGRYVCFQNGELYNYRELRHELEDKGYTFTSSSDTEIIGNGFQEWGESFFRRLDGMFAIVIFDKIEKTLILARDTFGEKPLYYANGPGGFTYSSSPLAVLEAAKISREFDTASLHNYLRLHFIPGDRSIFKGVSKLLPGHFLKYDLSQGFLEIQQYSSVVESVSPPTREEFFQLFEDRIVRRFVADVPVGVFLSGGLDSSVVTAIACRHLKDVKTFSIGFGSSKHDESSHARFVAQSLGTQHHEFIFDNEAFNELLPIVAQSLGEPVGDQALLPTYWLSKESRKHVKVALSGEGADEIFGGYPYYRPRRKWSWPFGAKSETIPKTLFDEVASATASGYPLVASRDFAASIFGPIPDQLVADTQKFWSVYQEEIDDVSAPSLKRQIADVRTWLCDDLLVKLDQMTMANSLEGRAPYLSRDIISSAFAYFEKFPNANKDKSLLREFAKTRLPEDILNRRKQGFVLPMENWLRKWFAGPYLENKSVYRSAFPQFNFDYFDEYLKIEFAGSAPNVRNLFSIAILLEWVKSIDDRLRQI